MTADDTLKILNKWAVVEYHATIEDDVVKKQWFRVTIDIPPQMNGKTVLSNANTRPLLETLAESLAGAETAGAKPSCDEAIGYRNFYVDELPPRS